ncbi:cyclase family protein [Natronosalvus vescus]|uniref:cyclase family protein n=1 Tax=Natronosalvus vescus TaxID=2953881 RepID=UPI0020900C3A|nr:cyclase family protein [Natronosalvus vescus]
MSHYDLSHPLETGITGYPDDPPVNIDRVATVANDGYAVSTLAFGSHAGTHIDAPAHMQADGPTLDDFDLETFQFRAVVADCRPLEAREAIDGGDLEAAVDTEMAGVDLCICRTGWDAHWGTDRYLEHPSLTADAADWLLERGLHVGIDALNVDPTSTSASTSTESASDTADEPTDYPFHRAMFADDRLLLENLRGLEVLPPNRSFDVHAYPLSVANADAAPVRAVAVLE